jgi:hypothetical protein
MRFRIPMPCSCKATDLAAGFAGFLMGIMIGQIARCQPLHRQACSNTQHEQTTCRSIHEDGLPGLGPNDYTLCDTHCVP